MTQWQGNKARISMQKGHYLTECFLQNGAFLYLFIFIKKKERIVGTSNPLSLFSCNSQSGQQKEQVSHLKLSRILLFPVPLVSLPPPRPTFTINELNAIR